MKKVDTEIVELEKQLKKWVSYWKATCKNLKKKIYRAERKRSKDFSNAYLYPVLLSEYQYARQNLLSEQQKLRDLRQIKNR